MKNKLTRKDAGKLFKAFHNGQFVEIRKIREVKGIFPEEKYEYYRYEELQDGVEGNWVRVQQLPYCDQEGWEYEPIGRVERLINYGEPNRITAKDIRREHQKPPTSMTDWAKQQLDPDDV